MTLSLDPDAVRWSAEPGERADRPVVVLLHGYGADEHDLFGLVPYLPADVVYAAVRAPLSPPWPMSGASWYPISPGHDVSDDVTAAAEALVRWLDAEGIATAGLLGFSQGGATALQALRLHRERVDAVACLGGYVTAGDLPGDTALREERTPVFWGRGADDDVISAERIARTTAWLPDHSELSGRVYPGLGHGISMDELTDVAAFLDKHLA